MRMNWYYRMMLSYIPIFFVVISSIIFIFFLMLNNASERKYIETNQAILERMVYNTDASLMLIERNVVSQLMMDGLVRNYFSDVPKTAYEYFETQKKLIDLRSTFPFHNTIYMYNAAERRIISDLGAYALHSFGDQAFLGAQYGRNGAEGWTPPRSFSYLTSEHNGQKVVSLVKHYYDGDVKLGAVVVNVYVGYIEEYLNSFNELDSTRVELLDATSGEATTPSEAGGASAIGVRSDYTGWQYLSHGMYEEQYNSLSVFSNVWMMVVLVIIVLALAGFTLVTHMHYKPIQSILDKVGHFSARKSEELGIKGAKNEFAFIETALDHLLQRSLDYEHLYKEDSFLRRQRLFHDLLAGHQTLTDEQFAAQMSALQLPHPYDRLGVLVAEIDYYASFAGKYETKDQRLLKFVIENAFHDLGQQHKRFVWHAWMEPHRIAFVVHLPANESFDAPTLPELAEQYQRWIHDYLELTITIGIGADSSSIETIAESYRNAVDNLELKTIYGTNAVIDNRKSAGKLSLDSYAYLQAIESAAQSFRMNEGDWREKLTHIFAQLKETRFGKTEMNAFLGNFVLQMERAISTLSPAVQSSWRNDFQPAFAALQDHAETLTELEERLMTAMSDFEAVADQDRQARRHHSIALQAKSYIDAHYADPDLSLTRVCDYLKLQPSALSQLFKEEIGEKFIDYVLKVRMERAKQLLTETDDSVQSIAEQVGYRNVISFYRVFKKAQGLPPGEYRLMYRGAPRFQEGRNEST